MHNDPQYDQFAKKFSASRQHGWPEFEAVQSLLQKNDRLLDLGCGNGRLRDALDTSIIPNGNYFGFDISEGLLSIARQDHPTDHFFKGNFAKQLPFGDDNFEIVVSIAAFHHLLTTKDQKQCLNEIKRVLKPGGKVLLTTWKIPQKWFWKNVRNKAFWLSGWQNYAVPFGKAKHPRTYRLVPGKGLKRQLKKAGFKVLSTELSRGKNWVVVAEKRV